MNLEVFFNAANSLALISWILLFVFFHKKWVYQFLFSVVIVLLALLYLFFILKGIGGTNSGGFDSLANVQLLFQDQQALLAGWIHYLAFDLFVGMWISQDADRKGINRWILLPCLLLTFILGPVGLLLYILVRMGYSRKLLQHPFLYPGR